MKIGMTLPSMVVDGSYSRQTTLDWSRLCDQAGFASLACGERITFGNQEPLVLLSAAAALTERIRIFPTVMISPMHSTEWLAKRMATLDVLSEGRLALAVGAGGREHDYRAVGATFKGRNTRMRKQVDQLRALWDGTPPFEGAAPIGPSPTRSSGIPIMAGVMGPKASARAAEWADGLCGSVVDGRFDKLGEWVRLANESWEKAGRSHAPELSTTCWYALGQDADQVLKSYVFDYMEIFGEKTARGMADIQTVSSEEALLKACAAARDAGCDEFILVPASAQTAMLEQTIATLEGEQWLSQA